MKGKRKTKAAFKDGRDGGGGVLGICLILAVFCARGPQQAAGAPPPPLISFQGISEGGGVAAPSDGLGQTPVHRAVLMDSSAAAVNTLNQLAAKNADFCAVDSFGNSPLHVAALTASPAVIRALLDNGARIDQTGADGRTALIFAVEAGRPLVVEELLAAGANPAIKDAAERTAHDLALASADVQIRTALAGKASNSGELEAAALAALVVGDEQIGSAGYKAALVQLRNLESAAVPPLVAILGDTARPAVHRQRAAGVLGKLGDKKAVPPLLDALYNGDGRLARAAAAGLKALAPHDHAMDICRYLIEVNPRNEKIRWPLYEALGTAGNPEALPFLMHAQANEIHPGCRNYAGKAVETIIGQNVGGTPEAQMDWIRQNRPEWMDFFDQQTKTHPVYMQLALFFAIGVGLAGGAVWFLWSRL